MNKPIKLKVSPETFERLEIIAHARNMSVLDLIENLAKDELLTLFVDLWSQWSNKESTK